MRQRIGAIVCLTLLAGLTAAEDAPLTPPTPEQAADAALDASRTQDGAALKALAGKDDPDPWLVADDLIRRRGFDAADAFAKAAPRADTEALAAYVGARRGLEDDPARRERLSAANKALGEGSFQKALDALDPDGSGATWDVVGVRLATGRGIALAMLARFKEAHAAHEAAGAAAERLGWLARAAQAQQDAGVAAYRGGDLVGAGTAWERHVALCERRGDLEGAARTLRVLGLMYLSRQDHAKALPVYERALATREALGDKQGAADTLADLGVIHDSLEDYPKALSIYERALAAKEALGDKAGAARTLGNIGGALHSLGDHGKALATYGEALAAMEALGDKQGAAGVLGNIGVVYDSLGDSAKALATYERALAAKEALGDKAGAARVLGNIGLVHESLGDYGEALAAHEQALVAKEALGDKHGAASTLGNIGNVYFARGDYAKAMSTYERALAAAQALGDQGGTAAMRGNIGGIYHRLGDFGRALSTQREALAAQEALGDKRGAAMTLGNTGVVQVSMGEYAKALTTYQQALAALEALGDKRGAAMTLGNIGEIHRLLGDHTRALSTLEQARAAKEALGDKQGAALTLASLGLVHFSQGDYTQALSTYQEALATMESVGDRAGEARTLGNIGATHAALGDHAAALSFAHRAVARLETLVTGLGAEAGAAAREPLSFLYEVGVLAALARRDAPELAFFLERGRAGALLEDLNAREALWSAAVAPELRLQEERARSTEVAAAKALKRAHDSGTLRDIRRRKAELNLAQEQVSESIARIQREAKAGASVVYPEAATLGEIQATLSEGDALVLYGMEENGACALVVTQAGARIVPLGPTARIQESVEALRLDDAKADATDALAALSKLVVEPLGLPETTKRLLVSPDGVLGYVPFAALLPAATIAYVPSGTTYRLLLEDGGLHGEGVLALGDPDYETRIDAQAVALVRGGSRLERLPATREEARAIGTVVLLASEATEAQFASAVRKPGRWRAVHFACHGLVNSERPALSSLAVTPGGDDDGFLTCLDVFRMKIPADLVVLSACETAKGRVVKTEGIVGMVRAFMFAGSPRVICSLWRVDDEATRSLMVKFYELWNPRAKPGDPQRGPRVEASKAMATAAALKAAQEYVRNHPEHPEWKHPYYWAAWVLWGLPD